MRIASGESADQTVILEGILTVVVAVASFWLLYDYADTAKFLSPVEKAVVKQRLHRDHCGLSGRFDRKFVIQGLTDWKILVGCLMYIGCLMPVYCFSLVRCGQPISLTASSRRPSSPIWATPARPASFSPSHRVRWTCPPQPALKVLDVLAAITVRARFGATRT